MRSYNKLVRDRIPEILEKLGKKFTYHVANRDEYENKLWEKLTEEVEEFREAPCQEEMADILEVINALISFYGIDPYELETTRQAKAGHRGIFEEAFILEEVRDE